MEKKKEPRFGSVEWQNEQLKEIGKKLSTGAPLSGTDKAFLEVQASHTRRRKPRD